MSYLLERMEKLDRTIAKEERALKHLTKQVGNKITKVGQLKDEYDKIVAEYRASIEEKKEA